MIERYTTKFYGVLPARVEFLKEMYKINPDKIELLIMGADDEKVNHTLLNDERKNTRESLEITDNQMLIVTGGKIDLAKQQILNLMQAIINLNHPQIKLVVYGSVDTDLEPKFNNLVKHHSIQYIGWIVKKVLEYLLRRT